MDQPSHDLDPASDIETMTSRLSGMLHIHRKRGASDQPEPIPHNVSLKTRLFGQSHWAVSGVCLVSAHTLLLYLPPILGLYRN
jgi:hypothetical protein